MSKDVLIVVHQAQSTPGKIGRFLSEQGYRLDRRCPCQGDPLPEELSSYACVIVFGGPQSANDDHVPGIRAELDWLERRVLPSGVATLGICLGAQQLARVLGARVGPHPDGQVEIGYYEVMPTAEAGRFLREPTMFYQWHSETFEIPRSAVHLASSSGFDGQAFCYEERVYALEFHPEITLDMIERWSTSERGAPKLAWPGAKPRDTHINGYWEHGPGSDRWLERFLSNELLREAS